MSYIVTVKQDWTRETEALADPCCHCGQTAWTVADDRPQCPSCLGATRLYVTSRRTISTLEEARDVVDEVLCASHAGFKVRDYTFLKDGDRRVSYRAGDPLPEEGGSVGPLPDGTLIEIRPERGGE